MSEELKPCPFCAGNDLRIEDFTSHVYGLMDILSYANAVVEYRASHRESIISKTANIARQ